MYSQCQRNHNDIHGTFLPLLRFLLLLLFLLLFCSTVTLCFDSIGYLVSIECDHSQSLKHLFAFSRLERAFSIDENDGVFTVTKKKVS